MSAPHKTTLAAVSNVAHWPNPKLWENECDLPQKRWRCVQFVQFSNQHQGVLRHPKSKKFFVPFLKWFWLSCHAGNLAPRYRISWPLTEGVRKNVATTRPRTMTVLQYTDFKWYSCMTLAQVDPSQRRWALPWLSPPLCTIVHYNVFAQGGSLNHQIKKLYVTFNHVWLIQEYQLIHINISRGKAIAAQQIG